MGGKLIASSPERCNYTIHGKTWYFAIMRAQECVGEKIPIMIENFYYKPRLNKTDFSKELMKQNINKTPILVFSFKTYIPHFFFFRLVALCFSVWEPLGDDLLCKNVAFFKDKGGDRYIAIAVNKTSIQLQVFTPDDKIQLIRDKTKQIRSNIEGMMNDITSTFHNKVLFELGYTCKEINITDEDEDYFLSKTEVAQLSTNKRICPNTLSRKNHEKHDIVRDDLLYYRYTDNN
ncbi:uncharacterized protein LOC134267445 [Saccostrea cucullata]|uniref:uncharacterized protein LOC134267445 n=1 Tax=Saccostrea cuccullata TaxID=36930 RepID=UPI002ED68016